MSKVQVVIELDKRDYEVIKITPKIGVGRDCIPDNAYEAIRNGTVLPDNHGRIIDGDIVLGWLVFTGAIDNMECGEVAEVFKIATLFERTVKE